MGRQGHWWGRKAKRRRTWRQQHGGETKQGTKRGEGLVWKWLELRHNAHPLLVTHIRWAIVSWAAYVSPPIDGHPETCALNKYVLKKKKKKISNLDRVNHCTVLCFTTRWLNDLTVLFQWNAFFLYFRRYHIYVLVPSVCKHNVKFHNIILLVEMDTSIWISCWKKCDSCIFYMQTINKATVALPFWAHLWAASDLEGVFLSTPAAGLWTATTQTPSFSEA